MNKKAFKIALAASAGGHLTQLLKFTESWQNYDYFFISTLDIVRSKLERNGRVYITGECNREHPLKILKVLWSCFSIAKKEKPNLVISTGAAPALLFCLAAKWFGAKILWIDSVANVRKLSMSGRIACSFSDKVLTQWPDVAHTNKHADYVGSII